LTARWDFGTVPPEADHRSSHLDLTKEKKMEALTVAQAAHELGLDRSELYELIKLGKIPHEDINDRVHVQKAVIDRLKIASGLNGNGKPVSEES